jgi:hypothetical protein
VEHVQVTNDEARALQVSANLAGSDGMAEFDVRDDASAPASSGSIS